MTNDELMERENATLLAFVAGVAVTGTKMRAGISQTQQLAQRIRTIRNAARLVIEHQFDDAEKAIAVLLQEGRAELRDGQIALVESPDAE